MPPKPLGIVIPTHNRCAALLECLRHLEDQTFNNFEVVIVDDGSTDETSARIKAYQGRTPLSIRYVRQENGGPAKARNLGVSMLESPLCLMIGDDIFASPGLVQQHMQAHQEDPDIRVAALGLTRWSTTGQKVTPFMRWLDEANVQFSYSRLLAGAKPDWSHFYTSNLSVKTELLRQFAFNEEFPYAAMEDMELGYRITKLVGLNLRFLREALADHLHPTTFRQACARMVRAGYSMGLFYDLWPEQRPLQAPKWRQRIINAIAVRPVLLKLLTAAVDPIADLVKPGRVLPYILFSYFEVGLRNRLKSQRRPLAASQ